MQFITPTDYILFPLYLFIFFVFARKAAKKEETPLLGRYLMIAFWLRMFGSLAYSLVMQYYYGYGDSFTYFLGGSFYYDEILKDFSKIKYLFTTLAITREWYENTAVDISPYFGNAANNLTMKISAVIGFFSFNKFLITSLFFGYFSFVGQWKLFKVFDHINKHENQRLLAYAVLFTPSIWFWGSGLLKDAICIGAVGIVIHFIYFWYTKGKWSLWKLIYCVILLYAVSIIKFYIIAILLTGVVMIVLWKLVHYFKQPWVRVCATVLLTGILYLGFINSNFSAVFEKFAEESLAHIESFRSSYQKLQDEDSKGGIEITDMMFDSPEAIIAKSPQVIYNTLYRPYLWESRSVMILFTALESFALLLASAYLLLRGRIFRFFAIIFSSPFLFFCFTVSMLFALVIGLTTYNFGTMIRYKIIFLPFFYLLLVNIYTRLEWDKKTSKKSVRVVT